jgi:2-C-methyl-D-erythritol 4-phosphate cytidylyltransferase
MEKFAIIVAGGSGLRMGADTPKQFLLLHNKPVLWHTINSFLNSYSDLQCIVVVPNEHIAIGEEIKQMFGTDTNRITITVGGATRFHSVKNGLKLVAENSIVFVHDGVRCMVNDSLIKRCYEQAIAIGSAIPATTAIDSIRFVEASDHKIVGRNNVKMIQTPQTFKANILLKAFSQDYNDSFTDEANVVEAFGEKVYLCDGDYNNIKITLPIDLIIAQALMK